MALAGLGPEIDIFVFNGLFASAPDLTLAGVGLEIVLF